MKPSRLLPLVAGVFVTAAAAQAEPDVPHDGPWLATIQTSDGVRQTARFTLREFAGEWVGARGRAVVTTGACAGKKLPITVQASTAATLDFTVWGSQVSPTCPNLTIEMKVVGDNVFEGAVEAVGTIRVTKR